MCGIAALYAYAGTERVDRQELIRIRDRMAPRGPDGAGVWIDAKTRVGLAHRRLAIIDLSEQSAQPMHSEDGTCAISFNGEIYNYKALRKALEQKGYRFRSQSDTEVLLQLYAEHGADMVHHLRGMYAFALWDARKHALLLARDPYGIKPLYYSDDGRCLRAASQVKALLAGGEIDQSPDPAGHVGFFLWGHVPEPYTLYRGIRALPAGSRLWADNKGIRLESFANITDAFARAEASAHPDTHRADAAVQLRDAVLDAVRHHLVADVEVGVFLSAGIDSATLAALATEAGGQIRTVTLGFDEYRGTEHDEVPLAEAVAARYESKHETVWVTRKDFREDLETLFERMDQPTLDGVNTYFVSRAAARAGLKVALSGLGGDELFGSYPSFRDIPRLTALLRFVPAAETLGRSLRKVSAPVLHRFTSPKYAGLLEYGADYGGAYLLRRALYMPWELPTLLDPDLAREGWNQLQTRARLEATVGNITLDRFKVSALESAWYMRNQLLRDADWAGMAHGLEIRVPLVDWTLLRTVSPHIAQNPGLSKQALGQTPQRSLPDALLNRPKTGFTVPVRSWMLADRQAVPPERGLRGWSRVVYDAFQKA